MPEENEKTKTSTDGEDSSGEGGDGGSSGEAKFSQADIDRIVADRLTRERSKFADYDELKSKAGRLDDIEAQSKTDLEKAVDAAKAEARAEALREGGVKTVRGILRAGMQAAKVEDIDDRIDDMNLAKFLDDNGDVNQEAIDKALARIVPAKPAAPSADSQGDRGGSIHDRKEQSAADIVKAVRAR